MVKIISAVENFPEIAELKAEILSKRHSGEVIFDIKKYISDGSIDENNNQTAIIDLFVTQLGYSALGSRWKEVNQETAQKIITFILTKDLAYSRQIMSLEEAENILVKLLKLISHNKCNFFTNASFVDNYSRISEWDSITKATFDTGIVMISNSQIGIIWVQDED